MVEKKNVSEFYILESKKSNKRKFSVKLNQKKVSGITLSQY
jgi:hypothetical protein